MRGYTEESSGLQDGSETSLSVKESWCGSAEDSEEPHGHSSGWTWETQSEGRAPGEGPGDRTIVVQQGGAWYKYPISSLLPACASH